MGHVTHTAIVITTWSVDYIDELKDKANEFGVTFTTPSESVVNGYLTVLIPPHGSKWGWLDQEDGDAKRDKLVEWLKGKDGYEWVMVNYGSDDHRSTVVHDAWA